MHEAIVDVRRCWLDNKVKTTLIGHGKEKTRAIIGLLMRQEAVWMVK